MSIPAHLRLCTLTPADTSHAAALLRGGMTWEPAELRQRRAGCGAAASHLLLEAPAAALPVALNALGRVRRREAGDRRLQRSSLGQPDLAGTTPSPMHEVWRRPCIALSSRFEDRAAMSAAVVAQVAAAAAAGVRATAQRAGAAAAPIRAVAGRPARRTQGAGAAAAGRPARRSAVAVRCVGPAPKCPARCQLPRASAPAGGATRRRRCLQRRAPGHVALLGHPIRLDHMAADAPCIPSRLFAAAPPPPRSARA